MELMFDATDTPRLYNSGILLWREPIDGGRGGTFVFGLTDSLRSRDGRLG